MWVRFTVSFECKLDPEDEQAIEDGAMTVDDVDWLYYMQDAEADLISIEED